MNENSSIIGEHNEKYIYQHLKEEKEYLDKILLPVDSKIRLDEEQRRVVLSDEDYTLVIAGAGAGKTTTVSAKVRYRGDKGQAPLTYYKLPDKDLSMNDWNFASYFGFAIFLVLYFYPIVAFIIGMMGSCRIKHRTGRFFRGK